jgi:hypothetical protein
MYWKLDKLICLRIKRSVLRDNAQNIHFLPFQIRLPLIATGYIGEYVRLDQVLTQA